MDEYFEDNGMDESNDVPKDKWTEEKRLQINRLLAEIVPYQPGALFDIPLNEIKLLRQIIAIMLDSIAMSKFLGFEKGDSDAWDDPQSEVLITSDEFVADSNDLFASFIEAYHQTRLESQFIQLKTLFIEIQSEHIKCLNVCPASTSPRFTL